MRAQPFSRIGASAALLLLPLLLGACGQRGPLYLPEKPAVKVDSPAAATSASQPAQAVSTK